MRPAHHPLFLIAIAFTCGLLTAQLIYPSLTQSLIFAALVTTVAILSVIYFHYRTSFKLQLSPFPIISIALLLSFYALGIAYQVEANVSVKADRVRSQIDAGLIKSGDPVEVSGVLSREGEPAPDGIYFTLSVENIRVGDIQQPASGLIRLFAPIINDDARARYQVLELDRGARLRVLTRLGREDSFRNPGVGSFVAYLDRQGYDAIGLIKSPLLIERLDNERIFLPSYWLEKQRQSWLERIDQIFTRETAGVMKASLLGNRYYLSRPTAERFREGGTFHLLVISGLHISFLGGLIYALTGVVIKNRRWRFIFSVHVVWAYTLMVGADTSVVRAALMFSLASLAPVLFRRNNSLNTFGGALLVLLVWRPDDLFDPSFQLTFLSVFAIIALPWPLLQNMKAIGEWRPTRAQPYPPMASGWLLILCEILFWSERNWKREVKRATYSYKIFKHPLSPQLERLFVQQLLRYAFVAVTISLSVQIVLLPLLIVYFHRLSIVSIVLNIWVGAVMAVMSLLSVAAIFILPLSAHLSVPFVWLAERLNWLLSHSVDPFVDWQIASVRVPEYTGAASMLYLFYYVPLLILIVLLAGWNPLRAPDEAGTEVAVKRKKLLMKMSYATAVLLAVVLVVHPFSARLSGGRLEINFLDVGQGDAALIVMPDGTTMLVDGGGRMEHKRSEEGNDENVDEAFAPDRRSIGEAVVAEYLWQRGLDHVDYLLATHGDADHIQGLSDVAQLFGVRNVFIARTPELNQEYVRFAGILAQRGVQRTIIGAGDHLHFGGVEANVLWPQHQAELNVDWGNKDSIVLRLTYGERSFLLTGDAEKKAETQLLINELQSDVVKVGHHGSKTSSTQSFVDAVHPRFAVISVGRTSPFGHPSREVVERWRAAGAKVLLTGQSGTISISTNGQDLQETTFVNN